MKKINKFYRVLIVTALVTLTACRHHDDIPEDSSSISYTASEIQEKDSLQKHIERQTETTSETTTETEITSETETTSKSKTPWFPELPENTIFLDIFITIMMKII